MGDEGLGVVEFQSEGLPEERGQPALDLLGFGLRPGKSQYVIISAFAVPFLRVTARVW
jgi:hypothetical protein